jgi:hypothetical protein
MKKKDKFKTTRRRISIGMILRKNRMNPMSHPCLTADNLKYSIKAKRTINQNEKITFITAPPEPSLWPSE